MRKRIMRLLTAPAFSVAASVLLFVLFGALLLSLPISSKSGEWSTFLTSLFTSVSAVCVTGLSTVEVATYFSGFGQAVLLVLIQVGGLGFITFVSIFTIMIRRSASLTDRRIVAQSTGTMRYDGMRRQLSTIFIGTFSMEAMGAVLLSVRFVRDLGWGRGIWNGVFTSVSAFCNAGFALTTAADVGPSLTGYATDPLVVVTVSVLVIVGGLGFLVWRDLRDNGFRLRRYSLQSKTVLTVSAVLVFAGWALFAAFEWNNPDTIGGFSAGGKICSSLFLSVTPRTAGFSTVDYASLTSGSQILNTVFMLIGGSSGSTAGGMKVTTVAVLVIACFSTARRKAETTAFKKRYDGDAVFQAAAVVMLYFMILLVALFAVCVAEPDMGTFDILTEVTSALCTVGLSTGITSDLSAFSLVVLMLLMYLGRVGGYTFVLIFSADRQKVKISRPKEGMLIG